MHSSRSLQQLQGGGSARGSPLKLDASGLDALASPGCPTGGGVPMPDLAAGSSAMCNGAPASQHQPLQRGASAYHSNQVRHSATVQPISSLKLQQNSILNEVTLYGCSPK